MPCCRDRTGECRKLTACRLYQFRSPIPCHERNKNFLTEVELSLRCLLLTQHTSLNCLLLLHLLHTAIDTAVCRMRRWRWLWPCCSGVRKQLRPFCGDVDADVHGGAEGWRVVFRESLGRQIHELEVAGADAPPRPSSLSVVIATPSRLS